MVKKIIRIVLTLLAVSIGVGLGIGLSKSSYIISRFSDDVGIIVIKFVIPVLFGLIMGIFVYIIAPKLICFGVKLAKHIEKELSHIPTYQLILSCLGLVLGLFAAYLVSNLYRIIPVAFVGQILAVLTYIFLAYLGAMLGLRDVANVSRFTEIFKNHSQEEQMEICEKKMSELKMGARPKILDTSAIIDGRILDISKTGFIEGTLIIPEFVLKELRHIADSTDPLKRNRGRRGLDILKYIQNDGNVPVEISDSDFEDVLEVDIKLLKLADKIGGVVVTNDYNLNKVASLQGVGILNVNELSNAVKPMVLPGEDMSVTIVREGRENNQGVGYLDDGTMIVVENGKRFINQNKNVKVTSVLQTAAGRMIFAKPY